MSSATATLKGLLLLCLLSAAICSRPDLQDVSQSQQQEHQQNLAGSASVDEQIDRLMNANELSSSMGQVSGAAAAQLGPEDYNNIVRSKTSFEITRLDVINQKTSKLLSTTVRGVVKYTTERALVPKDIGAAGGEMAGKWDAEYTVQLTSTNRTAVTGLTNPLRPSSTITLSGGFFASGSAKLNFNAQMPNGLAMADQPMQLNDNGTCVFNYYQRGRAITFTCIVKFQGRLAVTTVRYKNFVELVDQYPAVADVAEPVTCTIDLRTRQDIVGKCDDLWS